MTQKSSSRRIWEFFNYGLKIVIPIFIAFTYGCVGQNNDMPIRFLSYLSGHNSCISISELNIFSSGQALNSYAVMEVKKIGPAGEEIYVQKEWYKKPRFFRRERIALGMLPEILIINGRQTWYYALFSTSAIRNKSSDLLDEPTFFVYKISEMRLNELIKDRVVSKAGDEYVLNEEQKYNNVTTISQIWIDQKSILPKRWNQKVFDENNILIRETKCDLIEYNIDLSAHLFSLPKRIKQSNEENVSGYRDDAKQGIKDLVLDDECNDQLIEYEKDLETLQNKYPENPQIYVDLGNIALMKGNTKRAEELYKKSIGKDDKNTQGYINLINVHLSMGTKDQAIEIIDRYKEMVPPLSSYDYYILGTYYEKANSIKEAVSMYKLAVDLQPDDVYTDIKKGITITEKGLRNKFINAYKAASSKLHNKLKS